MENEETGYVLGYRDGGDGTYIIDGFIGLDDGNYTYLKSEAYRKDEGELVLVDGSDYIDEHDKHDDSGSGDGIGLQELECKKEGGRVVHALLIEDQKRNCLSRLNYLTQDELRNSLYARINIAVTVDRGLMQTIVHIQVLGMKNLADNEVLELQEDFLKLIVADIQDDVLLEVAEMDMILRTYQEHA